MTDMTQLENAFMKADAAGDTQAASVLAAEIKRQRATAQNAPQPVSGLIDQVKAGFDQPTENIGVSMEAAGKGLGIGSLQSAGSSMRNLTQTPDNFVSASGRFMNPQAGDSYVDPVMGFGWGNLPGAVAEQSGQIAGSIAARGAGSAAGGTLGSVAGPEGTAAGAVAGAFAGPALFEFAQQIGPLALQRAQNNGRSEPTWEDWSIAAAGAGASGALNAIGIGGVGKLNSVILKNMAKEGATEAAQSVVEQATGTAGTDKGLQIDPRQAVGEGILGAGSAGVVDSAVHTAERYTPSGRDRRYVEDQVKNNPYASMDAEIVQDINGLAKRSTQNSGQELQTKEVNALRNDYEQQATEAIKALGLSSPDYKELTQAIKKPDGLTDQRLNDISQLPGGEEVKALAQKLQRLRQLTVQTQSAKGFKGLLASGIQAAAPALGATVGYHLLGSATGVFAGSQTGERIGTSIARKLRNAETQGARINKMVGDKMFVRAETRAKKVLEALGPSKATEALNRLSEMGAERKAQMDSEKQAKLDWEDTVRRMKDWTTQRAKLDAQMKAAVKKTDQDAIKRKKTELDLAYRETRLKNAQIKAAAAQSKAEADAAKLEAQKSVNQITVELAQTKQLLDAAKAKATTDSLQKKANAETLLLESRAKMLAMDLEKRQIALDKVKNKAARAQKLGYKGPRIKHDVYAAAKVRIQAEMSGIKQPTAYDNKVQELQTMETKARETAKTLDTESSKILLNTLNRIKNSRNSEGKPDKDLRINAYREGLMDIQQLGDSEAVRKFHDALYEFAHATFTSVKKPVEQEVPF